MSEDQKRFFEMIRQSTLSAEIGQFFNQEARICNMDAVKKAMKGNVFSSAGKSLLAFYVNVWMGKDVIKFNLTHAAGLLDGTNRQIILNWFAKPFWP